MPHHAPMRRALLRALLLALAAAAGIYAQLAAADHVPDDPLFARQWPLDNTGQGGRVVGADVGATNAWRYTRGSPDVVIAVLDDGVQLDHPDLTPNLLDRGLDFTMSPPGGDGGPRDNGDRHGTSVAGIAAARGDNGIGISGMCPRCSILPLRVHKSSNDATAAAFRYAVEQGASIIVNSWGYALPMLPGADDPVQDAIDDAARNGRDGRGALVVFGVTNEPVDNCAGPTADIASLDSVVAVGVSDHNDRVGGAGFGDCLDLVAPSKPRDRTTIGVATTDRTGLAGHAPGDYDARFGGTSAAAPLVAGIAGLLLSLNPELARADLQRILEHTADKIDPDAADYDARGFSRRAGFGRVNAARALVPNVKIRVAPERVAAGEPFSVTVTASAPFGLETVRWRGVATGIAGLDEPHVQVAGGRAVHTVMWDGIVIERPGTYVLGADATDRRYAGSGEGDSDYPHRASDAGEAATAIVTVR